MVQINSSAAALRIMGEDLVPSEISEKVDCQPTYERVKGQISVAKITGRERKAKGGMWQLEASDQ